MSSQRLNSVVLLVALTAASSAPAAGSRAPAVEASAAKSETLREIPALMEEALVPGLQLSVISDSSIETKSFGVTNAGLGKPVTNETVFEAASLGKAAFGYGVLRLASAGKIDLDGPVGRYLPDLSPALGALTARQLLSHQAGLPNRSSGGEFPAPVEPGQRFSYSGEGFRLLQRVVEKITGKPLQDYMAEAVFVPLGMTSSSYVWRDDYEHRKAFGHGFTGNLEGRNRISEARAASSLETTSTDYARLLLALARGTGLKPAIARDALRPQVQVEEGCVECIGKPRGPKSRGIAWGLGIGLAETSAGRVIWHWGDNGTMQGYAAVTVDGHRGIVILTNSANGHSIIPSIAASLLGFAAPGYSWAASYSPYRDPKRRLLSQVVRHGVASASNMITEMPREDVVEVAERLLQGDQPKTSAALLAALPNENRSASEYGLLAEALRMSGRAADARKAARAALNIDGNNRRAAQVLERLSLANRVISPRRLALYAGHYSSPFGPLNVTSDGKHLTARVLDQPPSPMLPLSDTEFLMERVGVPITFVIGPKGRVTHAIVKAGGEIRLPRID